MSEIIRKRECGQKRMLFWLWGWGIGTDSARLGAGTADHFDDNELLESRRCRLSIMVFPAPSAGVRVLS